MLSISYLHGSVRALTDRLGRLTAVLVRYSQLGTTLGTASSQYTTTIGSSHAATEAMLILSLAVGWLERSLHL